MLWTVSFAFDTRTVYLMSMSTRVAFCEFGADRKNPNPFVFHSQFDVIFKLRIKAVEWQGGPQEFRQQHAILLLQMGFLEFIDNHLELGSAKVLDRRLK